jgi:hypothetical protein
MDTLATVFLGIMASIMLAGVPYAFSMHGRMSRIEAQLEALIIPPPWMKDKVDGHGKRLDKHSSKLDAHGQSLATHTELIERVLSRVEERE